MNRLEHTIVYVSDMNRSIAFYRDVLGLPLKFESPHWTEFANDGSTIALHPGKKPASRPKWEGKSVAGTSQLGFCVPDLDAAHRDMTAKKVSCVYPPAMQEFGSPLALYEDPDGMIICVTQLPTPKK